MTNTCKRCGKAFPNGATACNWCNSDISYTLIPTDNSDQLAGAIAAIVTGFSSATLCFTVSLVVLAVLFALLTSRLLSESLMSFLVMWGGFGLWLVLPLAFFMAVVVIGFVAILSVALGFQCTKFYWPKSGSTSAWALSRKWTLIRYLLLLFPVLIVAELARDESYIGQVFDRARSIYDSIAPIFRAYQG